MNNADIMAIRYPSRVNRTAANEDLYHAKQSFKNLRIINFEYIGISYPDPYYEIRSINSPTFSIEYVISGKGYVATDKRIQCAKAGDTFLLQIGRERHYFSDPEDPWNKIFITFSGRMAQTIAKTYFLEDINLVEGLDTYSELSEIVRLAKESEETGIDNTLPIITVIHALAHKIYCHLHSDSAFSIEEIIKEQLNGYVNRDFNMDIFAKSLNKSKSQITRLFKKAYGETPYKYLLSKRIDLAKTALTETTEPLKSISADLCFYDEYYFSSYFKSITGYSPSEYRKMYTRKPQQH